jgi:hypothetical protein
MNERDDYFEEHPDVKAYLDVLREVGLIPVRGARSRRRKARLVSEAFAKHREKWPDKQKPYRTERER